MVNFGSSDPAVIYGLNNALRYQLNNKYSFDFNIYLYGEAGIPKYNSYLHGDVNVTGANNATLGAFETFRHDNLESLHPSTVGRSTSWGDNYFRDVYYIRCGSITLGCTMPFTKVVEKIRVYFDITNPFLITNWDGLDPETEGPATAGQEQGPGSSYPNVKSFNIGVNITF